MTRHLSRLGAIALTGLAVGALSAILWWPGDSGTAWPHDEFGFTCAKWQDGNPAVPVCPTHKQIRRAHRGWTWNHKVQVPPNAERMYSWDVPGRPCVSRRAALRGARRELSLWGFPGERRRYLRYYGRHPDCVPPTYHGKRGDPVDWTDVRGY